MREIKFRAWDKENRVMLKPTTLSDLIASGCEDTAPMGFDWMQFTGLKDRIGTEIYEGDILRVWSYKCDDEPELDDTTVHKVIWCEDYPAFDLDPILDEECNSLQMAQSDPGGEYPHCEVIGNIHEYDEKLLKDLKA
jgi:uncharacterized phage protein (TIGR01671 family)